MPAQRLPLTADMEDYITRQCSKRSRDGLRACYPRDLAVILRGRAAFEERVPTLEKGDIDRALQVYFAG